MVAVPQTKESRNASSLTKDSRPLFFSPVHIQPKLTINQPHDEYEQEADAVADKVMRMEDNKAGNDFFFKPVLSLVQRKCEQCEEEEKLQRKEDGTASTINSSAENYIHALSGGSLLSTEERNFFEPKMGYDFGSVRLHTNEEAGKSAESINALAYTSGNNIVFGANRYQPQTDAGKKLLAHELTHVVQQSKDVSRLRIQRDVGWAARGTPYGPPLTNERSAGVSETISNAAAGKEAWNGTFGWTSRFMLSYDLNTEIITVIMRLHSSATAAVKASWKGAIEGKWSKKYKMDTLNADNTIRRSSPIYVDIQWVDDAANAHYSINPQSTGATSGGRAGIGGTSSMTDWGTADTTDVTHEFGHMMGNTEEYFTTNGVDYTASGAKQGYRDPSGGIMNNPSDNPEARHYESVKTEYASLMGLSTDRVKVSAI